VLNTFFYVLYKKWWLFFLKTRFGFPLMAGSWWYFKSQFCSTQRSEERHVKGGELCSDCSVDMQDAELSFSYKIKNLRPPDGWGLGSWKGCLVVDNGN